MIRIPVAVVLVLVLLFVAWPWVTEPPPRAPVQAGLMLQGDADNPVIRVEVVYASGEVVAFYPAGGPVATATPYETNTPIPSTTPIPTSTHTPTATLTPRPTDTPLPFNTPTPEETELPTLPAPSSTPGPKEVCRGTVVNPSGLTLRTEPYIPVVPEPDNRIRVLPVQTVVVIEKGYIVEDGANEWFWVRVDDTEAGWVAGIYYGGRVLLAYDESDPACYDIPFEYPETPLPPRAAAVLYHAVPGANAWELLLAGAAYQRAGIRWGAKVVNDPELCRQVVARGGECQFRSVHPTDCPNVLNPDPEREALLWLIAIAPYTIAQGLPDHNVWIEVVNECNMDDLEWWDRFIVEFVRLASERNWPPLILPTWNPGAPDIEDLAVLQEGLTALRDAGGILGMHAYSIDPEVGLCESDDWLGYRHRRVRAGLRSLGLADLPIAITEAARGAGNLVPHMGDFSCWVCAVIQDPGLHSVALWTAGNAFPWTMANLNGRMIDLAELIAVMCPQ